MYVARGDPPSSRRPFYPAILSGYGCLLGKSEIAGSRPTLAFKFQISNMFFLCSLVMIQYCGEPLTGRDRISNLVSGGGGAVSSHH